MKPCCVDEEAVAILALLRCKDGWRSQRRRVGVGIDRDFPEKATRESTGTVMAVCNCWARHANVAQTGLGAQALKTLSSQSSSSVVTSANARDLGS